MNKYQIIVCDPPWSFSDKLEQSNVARGAAANYLTMSNSDIKGLKIKQLADSDGAILALWVPSSLLTLGLEVMKEWGFEHKQTYIWVKTKKEPTLNLKKDLIKTASVAMNAIKDIPKEGIKLSIKNFSSIVSDKMNDLKLNGMMMFGMGRLMRNCHEICLIGINNKNIYKKLNNKSQRTVCFAPNLKHSAKPENLQDSLDIMFPNQNAIEIFARRQRNGWDCIGNQAPSTLGQDIRESIDNLLK